MACDCLLLLYDQPHVIPPEQQEKAFFPFEFMDTFALAWRQQTGNTLADYQFQKKLAQVRHPILQSFWHCCNSFWQLLTLVGEKHLKYHNNIVPANFEK